MEQNEYIKKVENFKKQFKNIFHNQDNFDSEKASKLLNEIVKFEEEHGKISLREDLGELDISWLNG